jgi:bacteriorhodopsin
MPVLFTRNDALDVNPQGGDARLSEAGSDWLWAVTAIYLVSFVRISSHHSIGSIS